MRLPARLLALYSALFDDLFQEMLEDEEQESQAAAGGPRQPIHIVPAPGVQQDSIAAVCRWMMGLLVLRSCKVETLVDMYRYVTCQAHNHKPAALGRPRMPTPYCLAHACCAGKVLGLHSAVAGRAW